MRKLWILFSLILIGISSFLLFRAFSFTFSSPKEGGIRKIIVFRSGTPKELSQKILKQARTEILKDLSLINGFAVKLPSEKSIEVISRYSEILRVDDDIPVETLILPTSQSSIPSVSWGVDRIDADLAWQVNKGKGIRVAVLDTGIDLDHPEIKDNIKGGFSSNGVSFEDDIGHGTFIAGIIKEIAPEVELYSVKVLDKGKGYLSDVILGLEWCIQNKIQVINIGFGSEIDNQSFREAILKTYAQGIVIVAPAGNKGKNEVDFPARYPEVFAITATDKNDQLALFSNFGPEIDFAAPGVDISSTFLGGGHRNFSGSSLASAHVTGTVALLLYLRSHANPDQIKEILSSTAENIGLEREKEGAGLVDAARAIDGVPPEVTDFFPTPEELIAEPMPTISAKFKDKSYASHKETISSVDPDLVQIFLDGEEVTEKAEITEDGFTFTPLNSLPDGEHEIEVKGYDRAGNKFFKSWKFSLDSVAPKIIQAIASNGGLYAGIKEEGDKVVFVFSEPMDQINIDSSNINSIFALTSAHSWLNEKGEIKEIVWLDRKTLLLTLADESASVEIGDVITPTTLKDLAGNTISGSVVLIGGW